MGSITASHKPHAVIVPGPYQGHIKTMLQFAKLLHHKGFHITFVNTEFNHKRFLRTRRPTALDGLPSFQFETIPDGLPPSDPDASQDPPSICVAILHNMLSPFQALLVKLNNNTLTSSDPPVTCIISDSIMPFSAIVAEELGIPFVLFSTFGACGFMGFKQLGALKEKGFTPLKDESYLSNGYLDTVIDWIPGMKGIRLKDMPSFLRTTDPNETILNFFIVAFSVKASAVILHTFDALEKDVLQGLSSIYPRVYPIGPLQLLLDQVQFEDGLKSIGYNLWKEDRVCLQWLDSHEPNSVVYVNFGSITVMTPEQLTEFAMGLANSKHPFLWIIRPDLVRGESAILPPEFAAETQGRSYITGWCPQEEVLNHPSIGGFLTHSGWGSTIESLSAGVPMLCWPFFADQQTNCRYTCNEWGVGMEIDNNVERGEVEKLVTELMEGEEGKKMKEKAMEWKLLAHQAASPNGSSSMILEKLINEVLL